MLLMILQTAYRYKYSNGEYSAVSQFSEPAFIPGAYEFSADSFLNEGMENDYNGAIITYNSGSSLVVGVIYYSKKLTTLLLRL